MGRFQFDLATRDDDAELRAIIAATPMEGSISISLRREPSFFEAAKVEGDFHQIIVCRDLQEKRIAGFGSRSIRSLFVNGEPRRIGYLSGLRALPQYRSLGLVARGYRFLRELHKDGKASIYLTTIAEGNEPALKTLTSSRAGLPTYRFVGTYHTIVLPISRGPRRRTQSNVVVCSANERSFAERTMTNCDDILKFWNNAAHKKQFFPYYQSTELFGDSGLLQNLSRDDLLLAFRDNEIVGTLGGWDQQSFKQAVVERYGSYLQWTRPIYNAWAVLRGRPKLPSPGNALRCLTAAVPVVLNDDPQIFSALLDRLLMRAADSTCDFVTIGFHERDPLLPIAARLQVDSYVTRIYLVSWDDKEPLMNQMSDKPLYLELGSL